MVTLNFISPRIFFRFYSFMFQLYTFTYSSCFSMKNKYYIPFVLLTSLFFCGDLPIISIRFWFFTLKKFVNWLTAKIDEKSAADYLAIVLLSFMIGRLVGTFLMHFISPNRLLVLYSALCIALLQLLCWMKEWCRFMV